MTPQLAALQRQVSKEKQEQTKRLLANHQSSAVASASAELLADSCLAN